MNTDELYTELERQYFSEEMQEKDEIELLPKILQGVKTFVDVGASLGQYAYFSGKIIKGGRIVCVEADPVRYERLNQMAHEWQKHRKTLTKSSTPLPVTKKAEPLSS